MTTCDPAPREGSAASAGGASARGTAYADVVVIGAGQAGLATAAHLRRAGFVPAGTAGGPGDGPPTFVVLDAAPGAGGAWRERWPSLTMRTVHGVYELPGHELPVFHPDEPAHLALPRYFAAYEAEQDLRVRRPVQVRAVRDAGGPGGLLAVDTVDRSGRPVAGDPGAPGGTARSTAGRSAAVVGGACVVRDPDVLGCGAGEVRPVPAPVEPSDREPARPHRAGERAVPRRAARTWLTRAVVNATGTWTKPFWPVYPGRDVFAGTQLHTHDFRSPEDLAGRDVLVVGGGTSAVQHLLAVHPVARSTTWVTRRPPDWREEEFSPELGRAAVSRVDARTRAGLPPQSVVAATGLPLTPAYRDGIARGVLVARPMFARLVADGARWAPADVRGPVAEGWETGPEHVRADVVLWATGFRAALDHLRPLGLRDAGGGIVVDGPEVVADPRVQLVGYGPSASTVGANRAGRAAARNVRRLLGL